MRAYSMDLRERVVSSLESGMSKSAVARLFKIDRSTVQSYSKLAEAGNLAAKKSTGRPKKLNIEQEQSLHEYIKTNNDFLLRGQKFKTKRKRNFSRLIYWRKNSCAKIIESSFEETDG